MASLAAVTPDQRQSPPSTPKIYYPEIKSFSLNVSRPLILGFRGERRGVREGKKGSGVGEGPGRRSLKREEKKRRGEGGRGMRWMGSVREW